MIFTRAFGLLNKAVMESSRVAENTLWIEKRRNYMYTPFGNNSIGDTAMQAAA
jgi:hypothetical protein